MIESPSVPTDFSDYSHYILYEGCDDADDKGVINRKARLS